MNKERSITFMAWLTISIIIAGVAACEVTKPLPSNIDALVVSNGALVRLHQALEVRQ